MPNPLHYINAGATNGTFNPNGNFPSTPADVEAIFKHLEANDIQKLTLHFHGGLVPTNDGVDIATNMENHYKGVSHPVSFIWETGAIQTLIQRFEEVEKTEIFRELKKIVIRKIGEHLGLDDSARGPAPIADAAIEMELQKTDPLSLYDQPVRKNAENYTDADLRNLEDLIGIELDNEFATSEYALPEIVERDAPTDVYLKPELVPPPEEQAVAKAWISPKLVKHIVKVTIRVILRFRNHTDHGYYPTVIEEVCREFYIGQLGKTIWDGIKNKSNDLWADNAGRTGNELHAGRYFLDQLAEYKRKHPELVVDLVGHSAGSIVICNLLNVLETYYKDLLPVRNILLLAPACRTELYYEQVQKKQNRFKNLRIFTMDEKTEQEDSCIPFIYTRSLLYLIAGLLEDKPGDTILGLLGQLQGEKPYNQPTQLEIAKFLGDKIVLSPSPADALEGFRSNSKKHGDFDDINGLTLASLKFIINQ